MICSNYDFFNNLSSVLVQLLSVASVRKNSTSDIPKWKDHVGTLLVFIIWCMMGLQSILILGAGIHPLPYCSFFKHTALLSGPLVTFDPCVQNQNTQIKYTKPHSYKRAVWSHARKNSSVNQVTSYTLIKSDNLVTLFTVHGSCNNQSSFNQYAIKVLVFLYMLYVNVCNHVNEKQGVAAWCSVD